MRKLAIYLALIVPLLTSGVVLAEAITNDIGLANPEFTLTFDETVFTQGTAITDQFSSFGVTFSPNMYYDSQGPFSGPSVETHYVGNNVSGLVNPFSIFFTSPQSAVAFGIATNSATTTFTAKLNGVIVESYQSPTYYNDASISFQGFQGILFDEIEVLVGGDQQALIDNIQLGQAPVIGPMVPVPANAPWALVAMVLLLLSLGFAAVNRRRG